MSTRVQGRAERLLREERTPYLTAHERDEVAELIARLEAECAEDVYRVILYGSKARGEANAESDTDILIVTRNGDTHVKQIVDGFSNLESGVMPLVFSIEQYHRYQRLKLPFYVNLRRDGIELWDDVVRQTEEERTPLDFVEGEFRTMNKETREAIQHYINLSHRFWEMALSEKKAGFLDGAVSRAYYAAFHAASAALFAVNIVRSKHSGIESALAQFLVKPGLIEPEYHSIFDRLLKARHITDYGGDRDESGAPQFNQLTAPEMSQMLEDTERFIARVEKFLRERGAMD